MATPGSATTVKSAMRTLDVIEHVVARPSGVVAQDIAGALDIPVSSLSYLLATLVEREYLQREGRRYSAGPGLERLRRPGADLSLTDRARPLVKELGNQLDETVTFFVRTGWEMEAVLNETAKQTLRYSLDIGARAPLYCVAAGKAILATMTPDDLNVYLAAVELRPFTANTIVDRSALIDALEEVRGSGIGVTCDEYTLGISGLGVAVLAGGIAVGGLGIAVPSSRFSLTLERRCRTLLREVAELLAR